MNKESTNTLDDFFRLIPKVDLHTHLVGSIHLDLAFDLLKDSAGIVHMPNGIISSPEELAENFKQPVSSLDEYLARHHLMKGAFTSLENIALMVDSMAEHNAKQGVMHFELRTSLKSADPIRPSGIDYDPFCEGMAYIEAIEKAQKKYRISIGLILCIRRGMTLNKERMAAITYAFAYARSGYPMRVGIDLAGSENGNPAKKFAHLFQLANDRNIPTTCHAGEAVHDGSVLQAIRDCTVNRVGHATSIRRGGEVDRLIRATQTPLELCMTANVHCRALFHPEGADAPVPLRDHAEHPVRRFFDDGYVITVNTDNPILMGTTITDELRLLYEVHGFSLSEIVHIVRNGIHASFAPQKRKREMDEQLTKFWSHWKY